MSTEIDITVVGKNQPEKFVYSAKEKLIGFA